MPEPLRPVEAIAWINNKNTHIKGRFHGWSQDHEEFESGPGHYPVALVETGDGAVHICHASGVRFLDTPDPDAL